MEDKKVQKINHAIQGVNAGVREVIRRFDEYLEGQSFGVTTAAIEGGGVDNAPASQITTISCSALKGDIPKDSYFIISYPDGTHPKSILNKKADKVVGNTSIVIHDGSTPDDQTYYADYPYPIGSLISAVSYTGNDTQFAAGNATDVQYNTSGQLSGDSNFTYNDSTKTLSATNIVGDLTGDVTGDLTGDVTGNVTGDVTGDLTGDVTGNVTGDLTGDVTGNADTATTALDVTNAKGTNKDIQFNDGGALAGSFYLTFDVGTATLSAINIIATNITGALTGTSSLSNGVTAYNLAISDNSSKVANTKFVHDAIADEDYGVTKIIAGTNVTISPIGGTGDVTINSTGGGGGSPAGSDTYVQFNNAGAFGASSSLKFDDGADELTTYALSCSTAEIQNLSIGSGGYINSLSDIKTNTEFKGNNIGTISDDAIYLTPFDFSANSDAFARPYIYQTGAVAKIYSTSDYLQAGFVVPVGYQATHIDLQAAYTGTVRTYNLTQFDWNTSSYGLHGIYDSNVNAEIENWNNTVATPLVGVAGRYWSISFDPQLSSDTIKGVKITIARV